MSDDPVVKSVTKKRYQWPPAVDESLHYEPAKRNPIHSILTALPIIMLVVGLYFYYSKESVQNEGLPIFDQTQTLQGQFTGLSRVPSGSTSQHYLWLENERGLKGVRVKDYEAEMLQTLSRGVRILVKAAPTVDGSKTLWLWQLEVGSKQLINNQSKLQ